MSSNIAFISHKLTRYDVSIRELILDVMKPHKPSVVEYARSLMELDCVEGINISMIEVDKEVENIELLVLGSSLDFEEIEAEIRELAGAIHSIDSVVAGKLQDES